MPPLSGYKRLYSVYKNIKKINYKETQIIQNKKHTLYLMFYKGRHVETVETVL